MILPIVLLLLLLLSSSSSTEVPVEMETSVEDD